MPTAVDMMCCITPKLFFTPTTDNCCLSVDMRAHTLRRIFLDCCWVFDATAYSIILRRWIWATGRYAAWIRYHMALGARDWMGGTD